MRRQSSNSGEALTTVAAQTRHLEANGAERRRRQRRFRDRAARASPRDTARRSSSFRETRSRSAPGAAPGCARTVSSVPGRFFFICTEAKYTSSAPAAYSRSMTRPKICGFMSSISHSSTTMRSVLRLIGALPDEHAQHVRRVRQDRDRRRHSRRARPSWPGRDRTTSRSR